MTTRLFSHLADNIAPPTISPQSILNALLSTRPQNIDPEPQLHVQTPRQPQSIQTTQQTIIYQQPNTSHWNIPLPRYPDLNVPSSHIRHSNTCPHRYMYPTYNRQHSLPNYVYNALSTSSVPILPSPSYPSLPPPNAHQQHLYPTLPQPPLPRLLHAQTQTPPPPLMIQQTIQTESIYLCDLCSVTNEEFADNPFTLTLRGLLIKELTVLLRQPLIRIAARTGRWSATMVFYTFRIIPTVLIPSLVSFINVCKVKLSPSQFNQQYIPRPLVRPFLYHLHTLEYICNNTILNSMLIPLTYYTTAERWTQTFSPLICLLFRTLNRFYEDLPTHIHMCDPSQSFTSSNVFTSFIATISNILLSNRNVQQDYFDDLLNCLPPKTFRQTLPTYPHIPVAPDEYIPEPLYHSIFTPTIDNINQQYTAIELAKFLTKPDFAVDFAHIDQFLYYRFISAPIHSFEDIKSFLTSPFSSIYNQPHETEHTHTDPSPTSNEEYESVTSEDKMANPTSDQSSNTGTPSHIPPHSSRDNQPPPRRTMETSPSLTQEGVNRTVQNRIDALWTNQIQPELTRSTDRMQKHLDEVHQQMVVISQTFTDQLNRMSSQTPPTERRSRSPSSRNQHNPSFPQQDQDDHTRQSYSFSTD